MRSFWWRKPAVKPMWKLVAEYCDVVGKFGPDSPEANKAREDNAANDEFIRYADALDQLKRHLGGSGMIQREGD